MTDEREQTNVESFDLDHRIVEAPYVRLATEKMLSYEGNVILQKWDLRFTQPNRGHLEMKAVHSLEHMFADKVRNHLEGVIDFSPMGCQTGFYLTLIGQPEREVLFAAIEATLNDVLTADHVPAANEVQCGWGANHSLQSAQSAAAGFLAGRAGWAKVFAS